MSSHSFTSPRSLAGVSTALALVAFAANSILCRLALASGQIGPLEFTTIRMLSGALMLLPITMISNSLLRSKESRSATDNNLATPLSRTVASAAFLFAYAICFSLAYVHIPASVGALILFVSVQLTMMTAAIQRGDRFTLTRTAGFCIALGGLVILMLPGLAKPPLGGSMLMIVAGVSWGIYSLLGKGSPRPVLTTARNFMFCVPACIVLGVILAWGQFEGQPIQLEAQGVVLAILSGGIASGLGYILWYQGLKQISVATASIVQLAAPVLAGVAGVLFLHEPLTLRLVGAGALIFGGITLAIIGNRRA